MTSREELVQAIEKGLKMHLTASEMGDEAEVDNIQRIINQRIDERACFDSLRCSQTA